MKNCGAFILFALVLTVRTTEAIESQSTSVDNDLRQEVPAEENTPIATQITIDSGDVAEQRKLSLLGHMLEKHHQKSKLTRNLRGGGHGRGGGRSHGSSHHTTSHGSNSHSTSSGGNSQHYSQSSSGSGGSGDQKDGKVKKFFKSALPYGLGGIGGVLIGSALSEMGESVSMLKTKQLQSEMRLLGRDERLGTLIKNNEADLFNLGEVVTRAEDKMKELSASLSEKLQDLQTQVSFKIRQGQNGKGHLRV